MYFKQIILTLTSNRLKFHEDKIIVIGNLVYEFEAIDKLKALPVDWNTEEVLVNVYIKSTLIINDPFTDPT